MALERDGYVISNDRSTLDVEVIHPFLSEDAYWSPGVAREVVERAIANSLCFGLHAPDGSPAGFARVVGDRATYAYLADVFVLPAHRGRGLGTWLVESVLAHTDVRGVRRAGLVTEDAHGLYARFGFEPLRHPERHMERTAPPG
jgi:GNAT superfamily N-acetyltransferase